VNEVNDDVVLCSISSGFSNPSSSCTVHLDIREPVPALLAVRGLSPNSFVRFDAVEENTSLRGIAPTEEILYEIPDETRQSGRTDDLYVRREEAVEDVMPNETKGSNDNCISTTVSLYRILS